MATSLDVLEIIRDLYVSDHIYLSTEELGLQVLVKTPHKEFEENLEKCEAEMSREQAAAVFKKAWSIIKKTDIDKIYDVQPAWGNFCDDIVIFFAMRWILFKKPVPIVKQSVVNTLQREGYEDPTEVDGDGFVTCAVCGQGGGDHSTDECSK